jgi:MFS family permease
MANICSQDLIPKRFVIAIMLFTACFVSYMMRVNMSINLIAMVEPAKTGGNLSIPECAVKKIENISSESEHYQHQTSIPDYGARYPWDSSLQSLILGSYFWGYTITCIPGGVLGERFGPTRTVMLSTLAAGFLTLLGPLMASWHYMGLIVARFLTGLCGVPTTKNNHQELFNSMVVGSDLPLSSLSSVALGTSRRERQIHRGPSRWYSWNHGDLAPFGLHHRESRLVLVVLHQWRDCSGVVRFLDFASC